MGREEARLREKLLEACQILDHENLVHAYGHVSARGPDRKSVLISPRLAPRLIRSPQEILRVSIGGTVYKVPTKAGRGKTEPPKLSPPLELFAHTEVYRMRPDVNAVCRVHGKFALVLSVVKRELQPMHELALALGRAIPMFDTPELISSPAIGHRMARTLGGSKAILLRGNGQIAVGSSVEEAVINAIMLETAAELQWRAMAIGEPVPIEGDEFTRLAKRDYEWVERPWAYYVSRAKSR